MVLEDERHNPPILGRGRRRFRANAPLFNRGLGYTEGEKVLRANAYQFHGLLMSPLFGRHASIIIT